MTVITDEEILQVLWSDPAIGFRRVYDRYGGPLLRIILRFVSSQEIAVEILHGVFVELLKQNFREFKGA
jgi:hypothetical protein